MKTKITYILFLTVLFHACKSKNEVSNVITSNGSYKASVTQVHDLLMTRLELKPDFKSKTMSGIATLSLKPHFYSNDSLTLDAKGMRIDSIFLISSEDGNSKENYEQKKLSFQ